MTQSRPNNKVLLSIIVLLLLTNIVIVGYFLFSNKKNDHPKPDNKDGFAGVLRKEVGFNEDQVSKFNELRKTHWADAKMGVDDITTVKNSLLDLSKTKDTIDSEVMTLIDSIARLQKEVEINAFNHVVGTRRICTDDQKPAYDSLMRKIVNRGKNRKPGGEPQPKS